MFHNIEGLIFDLDGTLTEPGQIDFARIRREIGCPPDEGILDHLDVLKKQNTLLWENALHVVDDHEKKAARKARSAMGLKSFMHWLRQSPFRTAILTRNSAASTALTLHRLGLDADFYPVVSREHARPKPSSAGIHLILGRWKFAPEHVVMIGDFIDDIKAGREAGVHTVLCSKDPQRDGREIADAVVSSLEALPPLFFKA